MANLILVFALLAIALIERVAGLRFERARFLRRHFASDLFYLATGGVALGLAMRGEAVGWAEALGARPPGLGALPGPLLVLLATALYDLGAWATHLLLHRSRTLWRFHKVHHSSRSLDWLATFRGHALEHALRHLVSPVGLLLVGFPLHAVASAAAIYTAWAAFGHSNLRLDLRLLEGVLLTPRLHRLHHVPTTGSANLGTIFSLWDRWLGSLLRDPRAPLDPLGVPGELETYPQSWLRQFVEPQRRQPR